ncbi:serine hydroxymethyltransferase [Streptomyces sp. NPDC002734]|uniref:serine hydroxymethyltransferase n=1 Tax=Streptomyces sp. NPDC002734 TaxID=3154426 RepID=UPI00331DEF8E
MTAGIFSRTLTDGVARLAAEDPTLHGLLEREQLRQHETLAMVAAASTADPSVLVCEASSAGNVTTEGYPGARYHAGCEVVDEVERLAVQRAKEAFGARYANVQPHSGSTANQVVLCSLLAPGDVVLGMDLKAGGHLTHGAPASMSGRFFTAVPYGLGEDGLIDYDAMAALARRHRPRLIFCGASAYPRTVDFRRFRAVADEVGAYLVADISHIAGLVAAGLHPSPVDVAHVTTTSTYKQLYGPRGGLILMGRDADLRTASGKSLAATLQDAVFPYLQGTPRLNTVAAKARALAQVATPEFRRLARRVVDASAALAKELDSRGHHVLTGGTDTHMVLLDVGRRGLTGRIAERALESCGIVVNKNSIPGDPHGPRVTSGVRLGTNVLALRGMGPAEMAECAELVDTVLAAVVPAGDRDYQLEETVRTEVAARAAALCRRFPLPDHPLPAHALPGPTAAAA